MKLNSVNSTICSVVSDAGYEVVDIDYRHGMKNSILQVLVDKADGINFDDLTFLSSRIGDVLDSKDLVKGSYSLEVSSPGIERPLKKIADYIRFKGRSVRLKLYKPLNGSKRVLLDIEDVTGRNMIIFRDEAESRVSLSLGDIAKANLYFDFNNK